MKPKKTAPEKPEAGQKPIPFDEALRRLVNAPPKHKTAADKQPPKKPKEPKG